MGKLAPVSSSADQVLSLGVWVLNEPTFQRYNTSIKKYQEHLITFAYDLSLF